jgi:alkylhydroperoxidase/carboxymuconolactone decarboxylase family protein YurZ
MSDFQPYTVNLVDKVSLMAAINGLRDATRAALSNYDAVSDDSRAAQLFRIGNKERALAVLAVAAQARDDADDWARLIIEHAAKEGATQRQIADAYRVSAPTINKWLRSPRQRTVDEEPF